MISHGCFHLQPRINRIRLYRARTQKNVAHRCCGNVQTSLGCIRLFVITILPHFYTPTLCHDEHTNPSSFFLSLSAYPSISDTEQFQRFDWIQSMPRLKAALNLKPIVAKSEGKKCLPLNFIENWRRKYVQNKQIAIC